MTGLRRATYFLWIICILLAGAVIVSFLKPSDEVREAVSAGLSQKASGKTAADSAEQRDPSFGPYEEVFSKRNVFQSLIGFVREGGGDTGGDGISEAKSQGNFSAEKYKIVGIFIDQKGSEAVVEDLANRKTVFLSVGDGFGSATVQDILPGKIILESNGHDIELTQK